MINFADQALAIAILIVYLFGLSIGILASAVFGSVRENRGMTLLLEAPDPVSAGVREFFNLFTRDDDGYLRSLPPGGRKAARDPRRDDSSGSQGQGTQR
jgi:hypothetical protein